MTERDEQSAVAATRESAANRPLGKPIKLKTSLLSFVLMFGAALLVLAAFDFRILSDPWSWRLALMFPMGMFCFGFNQSGESGFLAFAAYAIYLGLFVAFCRTRTRRTFTWICIILGCFLILNIAGCRNIKIDLGNGGRLT